MLEKFTKKTGIGAIAALVLSMLMDSIYSTLDGHWDLFMTYGVDYDLKEFLRLLNKYVILRHVLCYTSIVCVALFCILTAATMILILSMLEEGVQ